MIFLSECVYASVWVRHTEFRLILIQGSPFTKAFVVFICFVLTLFMFQTKFAYKNANEIYKKTDVEKNYVFEEYLCYVFSEILYASECLNTLLLFLPMIVRVLSIHATVCPSVCMTG